MPEFTIPGQLSFESLHMKLYMDKHMQESVKRMKSVSSVEQPCITASVELFRHV